jgi:hypothetical protein
MTDAAPDTPKIAQPVAVARLSGRTEVAIHIEPDAAQNAAIAAYLGLDAVRKFRLKGTLRPVAARDWELSAALGATVVQPCAVTLAPVTTRIDERVHRRFVTDWHEPEGEEVEMPDDVDSEPLGAQIDIATVALEALALAVPDFPRAEGVALGESGVMRAAPEGETPLDDDAVKPFAALAQLRDKLNGG